jgi:hypothetical protein
LALLLGALLAAGATGAAAGGTTADHSKFEPLQGPFANGEAVTCACLGCWRRPLGRERGQHLAAGLDEVDHDRAGLALAVGDGHLFAVARRQPVQQRLRVVVVDELHRGAGLQAVEGGEDQRVAFARRDGTDVDGGGLSVSRNRKNHPG